MAPAGSFPIASMSKTLNCETPGQVTVPRLKRPSSDATSVPCLPLEVLLTSVDRPGMLVSGVLRSFDEASVEVVAPIALAAGINVDIGVRQDARMNARVLSCTKHGNMHVLRFAMNADRRRHGRIVIEQPATIRTLAASHAQPAIIVDVSLRGLGLNAAQPIAQGSLVEIVIKYRIHDFRYARHGAVARQNCCGPPKTPIVDCRSMMKTKVYF